jgi:hypothetical protein
MVTSLKYEESTLAVISPAILAPITMALVGCSDCNDEYEEDGAFKVNVLPAFSFYSTLPLIVADHFLFYTCAVS